MTTRRLWFVSFVLAAAVSAAAQTPRGEQKIARQLIIEVAGTGALPSPAAIVSDFNAGKGLPDSLTFGSPESVESLLVLPRKKRFEVSLGQAEDACDNLSNLLILTYPPATDIEQIERVLRRKPGILHVEKNRTVQFLAAVTPNDPFFPARGTSFLPDDYQWGSTLLRLPQAWALAKGTGNIGVIDIGIEVNHPDLQPLTSTTNGNVRRHLSRELSTDTEDIDELSDCGLNCFAGHGSHVAGILAATPNNGVGVTGACWNCSLMVMVNTNALDMAQGLALLSDQGAQVVSMSFGFNGVTSCDLQPQQLACRAIACGEQRDLFMVASSGNNKTDLQFPASDPRVVSAGGLEPDGSFWDWANDPEGCPTAGSNMDCGSNYQVNPALKMQDLVAPATEVLSSFYTNQIHNAGARCLDRSTFPRLTPPIEVPGQGLGYDTCSGTSMAAPYIAGIAGILRSVNPLLTKAQIRELLVRNSRCPQCFPYPNNKLGNGYPDAEASVRSALGCSDGKLSLNKLKPLFGLLSATAGEYTYTTTPQLAAALTRGPLAYQAAGGAPIFGYSQFPDACWPDECEPSKQPRASSFVFATEVDPVLGTSTLDPLYRLSLGTGNTFADSARDSAYAVSAVDRNFLLGQGYKVDGIEGYIYPSTCGAISGCPGPAGTKQLRRYYNSSAHDYALFLEGEQIPAGYFLTSDPLLPVIGHAYANLDADSDGLIDAAEALLGTNPVALDTDNDGLSDGTEVLKGIDADPRAAMSCPFFTDGFETLTASWDGVGELLNGGSLSTSPEAATVGQRGLLVSLSGLADARASLRDDLNQPARSLDTSFYLDSSNLNLPSGSDVRILFGQSRIQGVTTGVLSLRLFSVPFGFNIRYLEVSARRDNGTWAVADPVLLSGEPRLLRVQWKAATAALANGFAALSVGDDTKIVVENLDNDAQRIDFVRFGAVALVDAGTSGQIYLDEYASRRID